MESLFWQLILPTAETQFIFNLFHLLLAGLTLVVLVYQLRSNRGAAVTVPDILLPLGFSLLVLNFGLHTFYFGAGFFLGGELQWEIFPQLSCGLLVCGSLIVIASYPAAWREQGARVTRWILGVCGVVAGMMLLDVLFSPLPQVPGKGTHSVVMATADMLALLAVVIGIRAVFRSEGEGRRASLIALASLGVVFLLHSSQVLGARQAEVMIWNAEHHILSFSLFAFAWAAGERSRNLLARIFVRLNLTFIILAGLIILITAGMEKYQYLRLAEERSRNLAEFIRGHIVYYEEKGESLKDIFRHPEVLRRVVIEFSTLPELRQVNVYLDGQRASFRYMPDREVRQELVTLPEADAEPSRAEFANSFSMIRLPVERRAGPDGRIEFLGTMDYINQYITKYILLIYSLFTVMVGVASVIIGMIVTDTDRRLRSQYTKLQEAQQQLAQAAKLASIGQLAGGVAHEINTPITSILSLSSHLAEGKDAAAMAPRQRQSLQLIAQQAERASKTVGNLLAFARRSRLEVNQVNVGELLEVALTLIQYRLRDESIVLHREIVTNLPSVLGDAGRLTEVFVNLLNNAVDAMPSGGTLFVRVFPTDEPDSDVRVEVSDTGCGIPSEDLTRIFDPFFTTKEPGKGTGLGLSISHGIVKDHNGQIWAQSQPGQGTTFVLTFPKGGELG